jgi:hypothetical protein
VARVDYEHTLENQVRRLSEKLVEEVQADSPIGERLRGALMELDSVVSRLLRQL